MVTWVLTDRGAAPATRSASASASASMRWPTVWSDSSSSASRRAVPASQASRNSRSSDGRSMVSIVEPKYASRPLRTPRCPSEITSARPSTSSSAARDAFEAALALDPDQPEARFNLANLVLEDGDLELAVAEFRRVLQADPEFADAHFNLAVALERLGGRSQARAHLERYLALEPTTSSWAAQARALIDRLA